MMTDSFIFYRSYLQAIETLSDKQQLKLYRAIVYRSLGKGEVELTGHTLGMFALIIPQIEANQRKYLAGLKGTEYGKLGGRPRKPNSPEKGASVRESETGQCTNESATGEEESYDDESSLG